MMKEKWFKKVKYRSFKILTKKYDHIFKMGSWLDGKKDLNKNFSLKVILSKATSSKLC